MLRQRVVLVATASEADCPEVEEAVQKVMDAVWRLEMNDEAGTDASPANATAPLRPSWSESSYRKPGGATNAKAKRSRARARHKLDLPGILSCCS